MTLPKTQNTENKTADIASAKSPRNITEAPENVGELFSAVGNVFEQLSAVETFMARRFDEISMEINATSQQVDMAEDGIAQRFSEILEILGAINYIGKGDTAANTGVELEAVIEDTESAANTILDSADRIASYVDDDVDWNDENVRGEVRKKIKNDIQEILLACTFQDLTGQRIRNTLQNLQEIESRLSSTFDKLGIEVQKDDEAIQHRVTKASTQSEVDELLKGYNTEEDNPPPSKTVSQEDIDGMFD